MPFAEILPFIHNAIQTVIRPGDWVMDATAGNGYDTLFLAQRVQDTGHVLAFDIQKSALNHTQSRLEAAALSHRVTLIHDSHENLNHYLPEHLDLQAAMFNLGYLPGADKSISTQWNSSAAALSAVLPRLKPGGRVSLALYPGHPAGAIEATYLEQTVATLPKAQWQVACYRFLNRSARAPYAIILEKSQASTPLG